MYKFSHIDAFYQIRRSIKKLNEDPEVPDVYKIYEEIPYRGTVKLHGSNCSVVHSENEFFTQSRRRILTPQNDNFGFSSFAYQNKEAIIEIIEHIRQEWNINKSNKIALFGEWCGKGINSGAAVCNISPKQWVLFAVKVIYGEEKNYIDAVPNLGYDYKDNSIYSIVDGPIYYVNVNFTDDINVDNALEKINRYTNEVEQYCPWAKSFETEGVGEGIVWLPMGKHWGNSNLFFKSKGEKHKNIKSKKQKEQKDPEQLESIHEFIEYSLTESRLNQGLIEIQNDGFDIDMKNLGHFLKWVGNDIKRECEAELEENNLDWKMVAKYINNKARNFFIEKVKN